MTRMRSLLLASLALLATSAGARADFALNFDEVAEVQADGLTVSGITFGLTGSAPGDAFFNSTVFSVPAGTQQFLDGSVLEGDSALSLRLTFGSLVNSLQFGVLLSTVDPLTPGFQVELFDDANASLGVTSVSVSAPANGFSEGMFDFSTALGAFRSAVITFDPAPGRFAVDNLRARAVPEPGSLALLALGAAGIAALARRRLAAATI